VRKTNLQGFYVNNSFLQSRIWAEFKSRYGWEAGELSLEYSGKLSILLRKFLFWKIGYIPHPFIADPAGFRQELKKAVKAEAKYHPHLYKGLILVRIDSLLEKPLPGFSGQSITIQPPDTVILDLEKSEDDLLAQMKKKTRYNIKLAAKKNVYIEEKSPLEFLERWYELYKETAERDRIAIHSYQYYRDLAEAAELSKEFDLRLYAAFYEDELKDEPQDKEQDQQKDFLAGIIVLYYQNQAYYLYGASSNLKRNLMPAYLLQWEAIKACKKQGAKTYDLFGIPPSDDPNHPMHGLYRFKTGFGGQIVHRSGIEDLALNLGMTAIFHLLEKARMWYYKRFRKRSHR
jgi:lipid II:glycine glycyltransferase (peptidoglycan interpeptide bridge formation enzyme)